MDNFLLESRYGVLQIYNACNHKAVMFSESH